MFKHIVAIKTAKNNVIICGTTFSVKQCLVLRFIIKKLIYNEAHVVPAGSFQNGQLYATCLLCGGQATMGIVVQGNNVFPMSINGSYILPNGVIVLVDEDFEDYMNGTLVFIYPNDGIIRSSVIPYLRISDEMCE